MNTKMPAYLIAALTLAGVLASQADAKAASTATPAQAVFATNIGVSQSSQAIFADMGGSYYEGLYIDALRDQVYGNSRVSGSSYFMRTVDYRGTSAQNIRGVYLDFSRVVSAPTQSTIADPNDGSGAVLHLGDLGSLNFIPDLRILAANLFGSTALTKGTSVSIPFSLQPEFTGSGDFELDFEAAVSVTAPDANTRVLTAGPNAVAHLYQFKGSRKISIGRFCMPFTLTVTKG